MSQQENKSALLNLKRVKYGVSKNGKDYSKFSFDQVTAVTLLEELSKNIENARGVTLTIFHTKQQTKDGSREFDSGYAFMDGIQEPRGDFGGNGTAPTQFRRTSAPSGLVTPARTAPSSVSVTSTSPSNPGTSLKDRIAKVKAGQG